MWPLKRSMEKSSYVRQKPKCRHIKEFKNCLEWSIAKIYLFRDKLIINAAICSPLYALGTESNKKTGGGDLACFSSVLTVHEPMLKVGQSLKGYWLKEFI